MLKPIISKKTHAVAERELRSEKWRNYF